MNRTMREFRKFRTAEDREELHARTSGVVQAFLTSLRDALLDQTLFDARHKATCLDLCSIYADAGFGKFQIGQAQKWLNMALKYVFVFGEDRLPGYSQVFGLAHVPLDNIILERLRPRGMPRLSTVWSRVSSYEEYMRVQLWVRSEFGGSAPMAVEFALWQGAVGLGPGAETSAKLSARLPHPAQGFKD
jgi:hypothetical protein